MSYVYMLPSCIITDGYRRSLLYDTQSSRSRLLSREIAHALQLYSGRSLSALQAHLQQSGMQESAVQSLLAQLMAEGFLLTSPVPIAFQPLSHDFDLPFTISNAIIDISSSNRHLLQEILAFICSTGCPHLQLCVYADIVPDDALLQEIAAFGTADTTNTIDLFLPFFETHAALPGILRPAIVSSLVLYNAPHNDMRLAGNPARTVWLTQHLDFPACCGVVSMEYFNFSLPHYTESRHHNSCLHRKIGIDKDGYIKNCPSMTAHYGHVSHTDFADVLQHPGFRQYWHMNKDQVSVCRNCEFRYVCTDCRAYLEQPHDLYSKPQKCGYDPYTCTWNEQ